MNYTVALTYNNLKPNAKKYALESLKAVGLDESYYDRSPFDLFKHNSIIIYVLITYCNLNFAS